MATCAAARTRISLSYVSYSCDLVQTYVNCRRSEPAGKPGLLGKVLAQLKSKAPQPEVLLPVDDFAEWERNNLLNRVLKNLEYLTFVWDHETEDSKRKMREVTKGHEKLVKILTASMGADDSDREADEREDESEDGSVDDMSGDEQDSGSSEEEDAEQR